MKSWYPGEMQYCKYADQFLEIVAHEFIHEAIWNQECDEYLKIIRILKEAVKLREKRLNKKYKKVKLTNNNSLIECLKRAHSAIHGGNIYYALQIMK